MLDSKSAKEKLSQEGVKLNIRGVRTEADILNQGSPKTSLDSLFTQISGGKSIRPDRGGSRCKGPGAQCVQEEHTGQ